jgi:hypothetical protein
VTLDQLWASFAAFIIHYFTGHVGQFIIAFATGFWVLWGTIRAGIFIADVMYEPADRSPVDSIAGRIANASRGLASVMGGIGCAIWFFRHDLSLLRSFSGRRFLAARYYVELQILRPADLLPSRSDYIKEEDYHAQIKKWHKEEVKRKNYINSIFKKQLSQDKDLFGILFSKLSTAIGLSRKTSDVLKPVEVKDFPKLDDSRTKIKRYFDALESRMPGAVHRFKLDVEINVGYLAPLFLITGLVNRFGEDEGWKRVLDNYRKLIAKENAYSEELRELRSFMFNCWLLWGPSIAPCSCNQWMPGDKRSASSDLMIQYGYGDENNSLDIQIKGGLEDDFREKLEGRLKRGADKRDGKPYAISAAPYKVKGLFRWGPAMGNEVTPAQLLICGGSDPAERQPVDGRIVLECEHNNVIVKTVKTGKKNGSLIDTADEAKTETKNGNAGKDEDEPSGYYSAYLWIMFLIHDQDGKPFFDRKWKNLLAFFEHGNIADATTYHTLKEQLVTKALSTLSKVLTETKVFPLSPSNKKQRVLHISYACALDDSHCGPDHSILFPPCELGRENASGSVRYEDTAIIGILRRQIEALPEGPQREVLLERLTIPEAGKPRPAEENPYSSCHLPEIVEEFYADLGGEGNTEAPVADKWDAELENPNPGEALQCPPQQEPARYPLVPA